MKPDLGRPLISRYVRAFGYAFRGVAVASRDRMFRTQLAAGVLVVALTSRLGATSSEWAILALTIAGVLACEALNSAVEHTVDLASPELHETARRAKDLAAGAVLIVSIGAVAIGIAILGPKLLALRG